MITSLSMDTIIEISLKQISTTMFKIWIYGIPLFGKFLIFLLLALDCTHIDLGHHPIKILKKCQGIKFSTWWLVFTLVIRLNLRGFHKLLWQDFGFLTTYLSPYIDIFYSIKVEKKRTFLDHLPTTSCKFCLWTTH